MEGLQQKLEKEINQFYQEEDISRYAAQGLLNAILRVINEENTNQKNNKQG